MHPNRKKGPLLLSGWGSEIQHHRVHRGWVWAERKAWEKPQIKGAADSREQLPVLSGTLSSSWGHSELSRDKGAPLWEPGSDTVRKHRSALPLVYWRERAIGWKLLSNEETPSISGKIRNKKGVSTLPLFLDMMLKALAISIRQEGGMKGKGSSQMISDFRR